MWSSERYRAVKHWSNHRSPSRGDLRAAPRSSCEIGASAGADRERSGSVFSRVYAFIDSRMAEKRVHLPSYNESKVVSCRKSRAKSEVVLYDPCSRILTGKRDAGYPARTLTRLSFPIRGTNPLVSFPVHAPDSCRLLLGWPPVP